MGTISLTIPQIGQPDTTEDVKIQNNFTTIQTWANGNIDGTNLSAAAAQSAGVNQSGQTIKGSFVKLTGDTTSSTSFTTLSTPDQVTGITLSAAGLLLVYYRAVWLPSAGTASAAIFLNANQLQTDNGQATPTPSVATVGNAGITSGLSTTYSGLIATNTVTSQTVNDVTTGQALATVNGGGPCTIFAAAGSYTVSVQFKASSGTASVSNRRLYVQAVSFS